MEEEVILHLFCKCTFFKTTWTNIYAFLHIQVHWYQKNFQDCVLNWVQNCFEFKELPMVTIWEVWKVHNKLIFEGSKPSVFGEN